MNNGDLLFENYESDFVFVMYDLINDYLFLTDKYGLGIYNRHLSTTEISPYAFVCFL